MKMGISWQCYNQATRQVDERVIFQNFTGTPFRFSYEDNKIFVIGCNTMAYMRGVSYVIGCLSTCYGDQQPKNGSCSGAGCCAVDVPHDLGYLEAYFNKDYNTSEISNYSNCGYVIVMEKAVFSYSTTYITSINFWNDYKGKVPAVMDWVVTGETCEEAQMNMSSYACVSENSGCLNPTNGRGYRCKCSKGFDGNPYVKDGCKDDIQAHGCTYTHVLKTVSPPRWFNCVCITRKLSVMQQQIHFCFVPDIDECLGASVGLFVILIITVTCSYLIHERRKMENIKRKYFKLHGGLLLFEEMKSNQGKSFTIFSEEELQQATNKFDENQIIGHGSHGTVYKGLLKGNIEVAVKRCMTMDEQHKKEFVYEFISNGTLSNLIHGNHGQHISLVTHLRIAHEFAEALAYLHSYASPPIIHGDVKSSNIFLDINLMAKVSDFGASILAPIDKSQLVTLVQGTWGYLDPEIAHKSVFNVDAPEHEKSLSMRFLSAMKENKLEHIMDDEIYNNDNMEFVEEVADLAKQCLAMCGEDRPSMKEVAEKLDRLIKVMQHPWAQQNQEEIESLLGESSFITNSRGSTGNFSIEKKAVSRLESGR
uniref:Protein kinase domain-containing protein n=1 Tax=Oryza brachyantha TaxID=4533 RepID=J3MYD6_ORYBR